MTRFLRLSEKSKDIWRSLRLVFLSSLLAIIVVSAHPIGPITSIAERLSSNLYNVGLDLSMQPLTYDMFEVNHPEGLVNIYQHDIRVLYRTDEGVKRIPFKELSLYRFRIPTMLFAEARLYQFSGSAHRHALCRELDHLAGPGDAFMIHVEVDDDLVHPYGLNMFHPCL